MMQIGQRVVQNNPHFWFTLTWVTGLYSNEEKPPRPEPKLFRLIMAESTMTKPAFESLDLNTLVYTQISETE